MNPERNSDEGSEATRGPRSYTVQEELQLLAVANARFSQTKDARWLDNVISIVERIVCLEDFAALIPGDRARILSSARQAYYNRYLLTGHGDDLIQAIDLLPKMVEEIAPDPDMQAHAMHNEGVQLSHRYDRTHALSDLEGAIRAFEWAVTRASADSAQLTSHLNSLAVSLTDRYDRLGDLADLKRAIAAYDQALQHPSLEVDDLIMYTLNQSDHLTSLFDRIGEANALRRSAQIVEQILVDVPAPVVEKTLAGLPGEARTVSDLWLLTGLKLRQLFQATGVLYDLERAIQALERGLACLPAEASERHLFVRRLAISLADQYEHTNDLEALNRSIDYWEQTVTLKDEASSLVTAFASLGRTLQTRFHRTGNLEDLEDAIDAFQTAAGMARTGSDEQVDMLNFLGEVLMWRYMRTRSLEDVDRAIATLEQIVPYVPAPASNLPLFLSNIGEAWRLRYEVTHSLSDLDQAVMYCDRAVTLAEPDSPHLLDALWHLAASLRDRSYWQGHDDDLDRARDAAELAARIAPVDQRTGYLTTLAPILSEHAFRRNLEHGRDHANVLIQSALEHVPLSRQRDADFYTQMGNRLLLHYEWSRWNDLQEGIGDVKALEQSIMSFQNAVDQTPPNSVHLVEMLFRLGVAKNYVFGSTGFRADLGAAIDTWERAWAHAQQTFAAMPVVYKLGQQRGSTRLYDFLVDAYLTMDAAFGRVAKDTSPNRGRFVPHHKRPIDELIRRRTGKKARQRALEIVEGTKSRLLTEVMGRRDLPAPPSVDPTVVAREHEVLARLTAIDTDELSAEGSVTSTEDEVRRAAIVEERAKLRHELDALWAIMTQNDRGDDGSAYVALRRGDPPAWKDLVHLASALGEDMVLASLYVDHDSTTLFIVRAGWSSPLIIRDKLDEQGWDTIMEHFVHAIKARQDDSPWDEPLRSLLHQALPLLDGVTRVVLAPAGRGHVLPWTVIVERAGWRTPDGHVPALVMLPALGILPRLRRRPPAPAGPTLVAGNPTGDLPFALDEARTVATVLGTDPLLNTQATMEDVLARLPAAELIHLASHAAFVPDAPLDSGIVLADGTLTAREVMRQRLQANLLVLSGCETGQVTALGGEELAGLTQAFLYAGARALVVSLWQVNDVSTALLMAEFYRRYMQDQQGLAEALRDAQRWLRDVTAHELAARFKAERGKPDDERMLPYERVSELWQHFQFDVEPDEQPFKHSFYWAAFTVFGAV